MQLPVQYQYLTNPAMPKIIIEAIKLYGTKEVPGAPSNPEILKWAEELGLSGSYTNDGIAWCGLTVALVVKRSGREPVHEPLWALNWANWGVKSVTPSLGDILVFKRFNSEGKLIGGHTGLYVGEDTTAYHLLAGNQGDAMNIARIAKSRLVAARSPEYINRPATAKPMLLSTNGTPLSSNEA